MSSANRRSFLTTYQVGLRWRVLLRLWAWGGVPVVYAIVCHWAEHIINPAPLKVGNTATAFNVVLGGLVLLIASGVISVLRAMRVEAGRAGRIAVSLVYVVVMLLVCPLVGGFFFVMAVFSHGP
jgi:hypothetical protein